MIHDSQLQKNIGTITENFLCTACGACAGICPVHAITMDANAAGFLQAKLNEDLCLNCSKCIKICPSNGKRIADDFIGTTINGYVGYALDGRLRMQSQSGGIVTSVLKFLLDTKQIDGAVVTRFNCEKRSAESFLATCVEDIFAAKGSHYTQSSPVEVIMKNQDKRLAAVLLGCQCESLELIKHMYSNIKLPVITIGLICGGNLSRLMVDDLMRQAKVSSDAKVNAFRFRDKENGGWPGSITIETDRLIQLPKEKRMELKPYYQNYRCLVCADKMNLHCDLVVGDPWDIPIEDEQKGYSAVITRTQIAEEIIHKAMDAQYLFVRNEDVDAIVNGQKIRQELVKRHKTVKNISMEQSWAFPYVLDSKETMSNQDEYYHSIKNRMIYTRELQKCRSRQEVIKYIEKRKKKDTHHIKEFLYRIKKRIIH